MIAYISTFVVVFKFRLKKVKKSEKFLKKYLTFYNTGSIIILRKDDKDKKIKGEQNEELQILRKHRKHYSTRQRI